MRGSLSAHQSKGGIKNMEKRMIGSYEIFQSINAGPTEIVMGEDPKAAPGEKYVCSFCESNDIYTRCRDAMVSDDYLEILQLYGQRVADEAGKLREAMTLNPGLGIDDTPVSDGYEPITDDMDLTKQVVLINPAILKREYQRATCQYLLCCGGFGASPNSRGTTLFCTNLFSGKHESFKRYDVLGVVREDQLPKWAKDGLRLAEKEKSKDKEGR